MKTHMAFVSALALACLFGGQASAQTWPNQPIKLIVPIAPGSVTDVAARYLGQELSPRLGQPIVVVNRPGANMIIGAQECAQSEPDGNTICLTSADAMSYNPFTLGKLPYDPDTDFRPVTNMYFVMEAVMAKQAIAASSMDDLRKLAISSPGKYNFGTLGPGSTVDTFRRWLNDYWKTEFVAVPYKGGSEIVNALIAGEIDVARIGLGNIAGYLDDKRVHILGVRSSKRLASIPNVPTLNEAGLGDYPGIPWWGVVVPAKTPDAIVARLNTEIVAIMKQKNMEDFMATQFLEPSFGSHQEFGDFLKQDRARAKALISKYPTK